MTHNPDTFTLRAVCDGANSVVRNTSAQSTYAGVMDREYADRRRSDGALIHRYRVRGVLVARLVRKYLGAGDIRLLDVGTADGLALIETAQRLRDGEFVGVEYSRDLLAMAPKSLPACVTLVQGDAMSLPDEVTNASFDVATAIAVLEHLPDPVAALGELRRALRPGGLMVATSPNPFWDTISAGLGIHADEHHVDKMSLHRLSDIATKAGFDCIGSGRFMWAPLAVLPYVRIPVSPKLSLTVDAAVNRIPLLRLLCVNSYVVGRRPA